MSTIGKCDFIREMRGMKGECVCMKGFLVLVSPKSLSQGSGPSKSQRNALSLFDLYNLSTRTYLWEISEAKG